MATIKQRKTAAILMEKPGISVSKAMIEAGYTEASAKNPQELTESKAWPSLVEEMLPDTLLTKVHKEGLEANRVISARVTNKDADVDTDDFIEVPDHATRHKFLELGYKVKGKLQGDTNQTAIIVPVFIQQNVTTAEAKDDQPAPQAV